jgi:hypothetical protein
MMPISTAKKLVLGLLGGSASFSPLSIPGLALWLDASDASTLFQDDAGTTPAAADTDPVGYWGDKSGNARHAIQATAGSKPTLQTGELNGKNVIRWDTGDLLVSTFGGTLAQPNTVWIIAKGAGTYYCDGIDGANRHAIFYDSALLSMFAGAQIDAAGITPTDWSVLTARFNTAASNFRHNGVSKVTGDPGANALTGLTVGNRNGGGANALNGDIAEIIVAAGAASAATVSAVESYLNTKWAAY